MKGDGIGTLPTLADCIMFVLVFEIMLVITGAFLEENIFGKHQIAEEQGSP